MDFLPPQCGSASHRRTAHRRTATVGTARLAPQCGSACHRHRAPSHRANASHFLEYNAVIIVFILSSLPLHDGVAPVACFTK